MIFIKGRVKKHKYLIPLCLLILVVLSYGKIIQMYYWVDDWAMAYKVIFPGDRLSNMEPGIFGGGLYRYLLTPFHLLFPFFGFNTYPYFLIGLILYFLAAFSVYLLARELTQKYSIGLSAAAIFASGYIGSHALYRLTNSYQTVGATLFLCLTVWLFVKHLRHKSLRLYWLSVLLFSLVMEFFFIRTHGFFLVILAAAFFYRFTKQTSFSLKSILLKLTPFLFIFYYMYFLDPRVSGGSKLDLGGTVSILKSQVQLMNNLLITLANTLLPDQMINGIYTKLLELSKNSTLISPTKLPTLSLTLVFLVPAIFSTIKNKKVINNILYIVSIGLLLKIVFWSLTNITTLWNPKGVDIFSSMLGGSLLLTFIYIALSNLSKNRSLSLTMIFSLFWIFVNSILFFIYSPSINIESSSRYLLPCLPGVGLLYATTFFLIIKGQKAVTLVAIICLVLLYYSNKEADYIIQNVTLPDKQGYNLIKKEVDKVDERTVFYIETADDPRFKNNYLGNLPQYGISALYHYHGVTTIADSYDDLFAKLASNKTSLDHIYTYYFGEDGYLPTSTKLRKLLTSGGDQKLLDKWSSNLPFESKDDKLVTQTAIRTSKEKTLGVNPTLVASINYDSLVPSILEFTLTTQPLSLSDLNFPYLDVTKQYSPQVGVENIGKIEPLATRVDNSQVLTTLRDESLIRDFRSSARIKASSSYKTTGEDYLIDGKLDSNWGADPIKWNEGKPQDLVIDLGKFMNVKKLVRVNHHYMATPTTYSIYSSNDALNWIKIIEVKGGSRQDGGAILEDELPAMLYTRFLKITITKTFGGIGYPPAIDELWISNITDKVDSKLREKVIVCPACYILDLGVAEEILGLTKQIATARVWWETEVRAGFVLAYSTEFPIFMDGLPHTYKINLPAQGTQFKQLKIDGFQFPLKVTLYDATLKSLSLEEIKR